MKAFLDTNILIDVLDQRQGYEDSLAILQMGLDGVISLAVTDLTLINIAYICQKSAGTDKIYEFIAFICKFIDVLAIGKEPIIEAVNARHRDFEDYVQYATAKRNGMDCIVTRNVKDYFLPDIDVFTPSDFLKRILQ